MKNNCKIENIIEKLIEIKNEKSEENSNEREYIKPLKMYSNTKK